MLYIKNGGKLGYLNGKVFEPKADDASYDKWEGRESMIMSWLLHLMLPVVSKGYLFLRMTKEVWNATA